MSEGRYLRLKQSPPRPPRDPAYDSIKKHLESVQQTYFTSMREKNRELGDVREALANEKRNVQHAVEKFNEQRALMEEQRKENAALRDQLAATPPPLEDSLRDVVEKYSSESPSPRARRKRSSSGSTGSIGHTTDEEGVASGASTPDSAARLGKENKPPPANKTQSKKKKGSSWGGRRGTARAAGRRRRP